MTAIEKIQKICPEAQVSTSGDTIVTVPSDRLAAVAEALRKDEQEPMDYLRDIVTAYHEAGHAVAGFYCKHHPRVHERLMAAWC